MSSNNCITLGDSCKLNEWANNIIYIEYTCLKIIRDVNYFAKEKVKFNNLLK